MKKTPFISLVISLLCFGAVCGCSKKTESSSVDNSVVQHTSTTVSSTTEKTVTSVSTAALQSTRTTIQISTEPPTDAPDNTESESDDSSQGFSDSMSAAIAFYDAYINYDAEAVYAMFDKEEIQCFYKLVEHSLDGKSPEEVFRKSVVIRAINSSMDNISGIMESSSDSSTDKWSVQLNDSDLKLVDNEVLEEFNTTLGTSYTSVAECRFVFYQNETNGESFSGNSSAFVERNGKWYLSYSNAMGVELMNYIELDLT